MRSSETISNETEGRSAVRRRNEKEVNSEVMLKKETELQSQVKKRKSEALISVEMAKHCTETSRNGVAEHRRVKKRGKIAWKK